MLTHLVSLTFLVEISSALTGIIGRDVITTGPGTTTIRFKADNPAPWVLHCHIEVGYTILRGIN